MANAVTKVNSIAIANIAKINGQNDSDLAKLNTLEFTGVLPEAHVLIATDLASKGDGSHATLGFTSGIDSTYDVYEWIFTNIHGEDDTATFGFQFNEETITSTFFDANASEGGSGWLSYDALYDQGDGTGYQALAINPGNDNDQSLSGSLTLYAPSSTTYVKHFMARLHRTQKGEYLMDTHVAGYVNTTSAIDDISFAFDCGEIQGGEIRMYGIAKS